MSWERYDDSGTRWSWTADDVRHLLANADELDAAAPPPVLLDYLKRGHQ